MVDTTPVQDALRAITAAQSDRTPLAAAAVPSASRRLRSAMCALLVVMVIGTTGAAAAFALTRPPSGACQPITYSFVGALPQQARTEFERAVSEIHAASGLVFHEETADMGTLQVVWSDRPVRRAPSPVVAGGTARALGYGESRWENRKGGGRRLAAGLVEVDATAKWPFGINRRDGLAAVFAHELGHVAGLAHNADPASFMYPVTSQQAPRWTATDRQRLVLAGQQAGCAVTARAPSTES